jgi:YesN/AraC family two-component response regulator
MEKGEKKRILVLEDEAIISHDIKQILEREGYEVLIDCFTVETAIEMAQVFLPDLALVDINLNQKKSGIDFASYWSSQFDLPFIFITAYSDKNTLDSLLHLSPSGFITKPFKQQDLISTVYLVLNKPDAITKSVDQTKLVPFAITRIVEHIHQNILGKIEIEDLAAMTIWGVDRFSKLFKDHLGMSPYRYILKAKIEHSKELLATDESICIETLCYQLGFTSYSNFYNAFKKFTNMTPLEYKKIYSKK